MRPGAAASTSTMAVPRCKWMAAPPHAPTRRQRMIWVPSCSLSASWRGGSEVTATAWRGHPRCQLIPSTSSSPSLGKLQQRCLLLTTAPLTFSESRVWMRDERYSSIPSLPAAPRRRFPLGGRVRLPAPLLWQPNPAQLCSASFLPLAPRPRLGGAALSPLALKSPLASETSRRRKLLGGFLEPHRRRLRPG